MTAIPFQDAVAGSAKKAMNELGAKSRDLYMVPIDGIRKHPNFNIVRIDKAKYDAKVREIADSIKANGFYSSQPIKVFVAKEDGAEVVYVTNGHTRLDAARLAIEEGCQLEHLPAVPWPAGTTVEDITVSLYTENNGDPITPYGIALLCKRLVELGVEDTKIAERFSLGIGYVRSLLQLAGAPKAVREMVQSGKVSATLAVETLKKEGSNAVKVLQASEKVAQELGKDKVTKKVVKKANGEDKPKKPRKDKVTKVSESPPAQPQLPLAEDPSVTTKLVKAMTAALAVVTKSNAWDTMPGTVQKIVTEAHDAGTRFLQGDEEPASNDPDAL